MPKQETLTEDQISSANKQALAIFREVPRRRAIDSAAQVYINLWQKDEGTGLPTTTVFESDGIHAACRRLLKTIQSPDLPLHNPVLDLPVVRLKRLIFKTTPNESLRLDLADSIVRAIARKRDEDFQIYRDSGRHEPNDATDWIALLGDQFGPDPLAEAIHKHRRLFTIIEKTRLLTHSFYIGMASPNHENTECPLGSYQEEAYKLRGLGLVTIEKGITTPYKPLTGL